MSKTYSIKKKIVTDKEQNKDKVEEKDEDPPYGKVEGNASQKIWSFVWRSGIIMILQIIKKT